MIRCNGKEEGSGEMKRQKGWGKIGGSGKVGKNVTVNVDSQGEEEVFFNYFFIFKNRENKSFKKEKKKLENKWMIWPLMWLNGSVTICNNCYASTFSNIQINEVLYK